MTQQNSLLAALDAQAMTELMIIGDLTQEIEELISDPEWHHNEKADQVNKLIRARDVSDERLYALWRIKSELEKEGTGGS